MASVHDILCFLFQANHILVKCRKIRTLAVYSDTMQSTMACAKKVEFSWILLARLRALHVLSFFSDLIFSFVDELQADQTPETVHLMSQGSDLVLYV